MTGRTHDLAAISAASLVFVNFPPDEMTLATLVVSILVVFMGGLFPDLDDNNADFWEKIPGGSLIGQLIAPLLGGHRMVSHSLLGLGVAGWLMNKLLTAIGGVLLVDMNIVWWSFMIGYISHLLADSLTKQGVPLFFPIPVRMGFPPIKGLRMRTGGKIEKYLVYPGLMLSMGYLLFTKYEIVLQIMKALH